MNTKEFLANVVYWGDGWIVVTVLQNGPPFELAFDNIDQCAWNVERLNKEPHKNVFICMSSQAERASPRLSRAGKMWQPGKRSQEGAKYLKAIWLDVDVKDGAYRNIGEAAVALKTFCQTINMPWCSIVVQTGGGLHAYWLFSDPLPKSDWQIFANQLANAALQNGLKCDLTVTTDAARILRMPGSKNWKTNTPRDVVARGDMTCTYSADTLRKILSPFSNTMSAPIARSRSVVPHKSGSTGPVPNTLGSGVEPRQAAPVTLAALEEICPFVRETLATEGAGYSQPLWNISGLIAAFTVEGVESFKRMSRGYATYDEAKTEELFERKKQEVAKKVGWPSCKAIQAAGSTVCNGCTHFSKGQSPFHFVKKEIDLPWHYTRDENGIIGFVKDDAGGNQLFLPVVNYVIDEPKISTDPLAIVFTAHVEGRRKQCTFPQEMLGSNQDCFKAASKNNIIVHDHQVKNFRTFLMAWLQQLQQSKEMVTTASTPFGWEYQKGKPAGFSYGGRTFSPTGDVVSAEPDHILRRQYTPAGDIAPWREAAQMIVDQKRPELDAILSVAFGAPLVTLTGHRGLLMSAYSPQSGIGKSTAMKVSQAVWGDPVKAMQSLDDTQNAVLHKMGQIANLPMYWDEIKGDVETQKFVNLAVQLDQGKGKSRMTSAIELRDPMAWETILMTASNDSLLDPIVRKTKNNTAGLYRCFEYVVHPSSFKQIGAGKASRLISELHQNFGHAGFLYSRFIGTNIVRLQREVSEFQDKITIKTNATNDERFWMAIITVVIMGARYANELNLTNLDIRRLLEHMLNTLDIMRRTKKSFASDVDNPVHIRDILGDYLSTQQARNTLITNRVYKGPGRPIPTSITIHCDMKKLDVINVHHGRDDGIIRIRRKHFLEWLRERGYSSVTMLKQLREKYSVKEISAIIGTGTDRASSFQEYIIELDEVQVNAVGDP